MNALQIPRQNSMQTHQLGGLGYMGGSVLEDRPGIWFIQLRWKGKTERFYRFELYGEWNPFTSKEHGEKVLAKMQDHIDRKIFNPEAFRPNSPLSIKRFAEVWLGLADVVKNTRKRYKSQIGHCIKHLGAEKDIREISKVDILTLKKKLETKYAPKTVYNDLTVLKTMLRFALDNKDLRELPSFPELKLPIPKVIAAFSSISEQDSVLSQIPERHRPVFEFMAEWGLRPQEARAFKKDSIKDGMIIIQRRFSEYELLEGDKVGKIRAYVINPKVEDILRRAAPSFSEFVFTHNGRSPYDEKILNRIWKEACGKAGVKIKLYNGMRHSRAKSLLDAGVPMELVSETLGHSKMQMTRDMYGRFSPAKINEAIERARVYQFTDKLPTKKEPASS